MITACIIAAFLAVAAAPPADCELTDNRCKAELYKQRAAAASTPGQRALYLYMKHRSHLYVFEETGDVSDLCAAHRALKASLAVKGQPAAQRAKFKAGQAELASIERERGLRCGAPRQPNQTNAPTTVADAAVIPARVDAAPAASVAVDPVMASPPPAAAVASTAEPASALTDIFMPVTRRTPTSFTTVSLPKPQPQLKPQPRLKPQPQPRADDPRPGRGLVVAGGVTLGVGVALTAVAGYKGGRALETHQEILALDRRISDYGTMAQAAQDNVLRRDYQTLEVQTIALAVTGGATVVVAAVLAGVGGRRMARAASRTALLPAPGGLVFSARF